MTVGIQQDYGTINAWAGNIALDLEKVMTQINNFRTFLDEHSTTELMTSPYNFSQDDVDLLKGSFTDLSALYAIYKGIAANPVAMKYDRIAKKLRGASCW